MFQDFRQTVARFTLQIGQNSRGKSSNLKGGKLETQGGKLKTEGFCKSWRGGLPKIDGKKRLGLFALPSLTHNIGQFLGNTTLSL